MKLTDILAAFVFGGTLSIGLFAAKNSQDAQEEVPIYKLPDYYGVDSYFHQGWLGSRHGKKVYDCNIREPASTLTFPAGQWRRELADFDEKPGLFIQGDTLIIRTEPYRSELSVHINHYGVLRCYHSLSGPQGMTAREYYVPD